MQRCVTGLGAGEVGLGFLPAPAFQHVTLCLVGSYFPERGARDTQGKCRDFIS